jgi:hypothetical protein
VQHRRSGDGEHAEVGGLAASESNMQCKTQNDEEFATGFWILDSGY